MAGVKYSISQKPLRTTTTCQYSERTDKKIFYYPNRPTLVSPDPENPLNPRPDYIKGLELSGKYISEFKWNGDNVIIYTNDLSFWNRNGEKMSYVPPPAMLEELKQFPTGCRLNGELIHRHTKNIKNLLIIHCVMEWKGRLLLGKKWGDSRKILEGLSWLPCTDGTRLHYDRHVLLAQKYEPDPEGMTFWFMYQKAVECDESIEGIILKNPSGLLRFSAFPVENVPWMLKIRKPSNKYYF